MAQCTTQWNSTYTFNITRAIYTDTERHVWYVKLKYQIVT